MIVKPGLLDVLCPNSAVTTRPLLLHRRPGAAPAQRDAIRPTPQSSQLNSFSSSASILLHLQLSFLTTPTQFLGAQDFLLTPQRQ